MSPTWLDVFDHPARREIVASLATIGEATAATLVERSNASEPTVRRQLEVLVELGIVRARPGTPDWMAPGRPPARFALDADKGKAAIAALELLQQSIGSCLRRSGAPRSGR